MSGTAGPPVSRVLERARSRLGELVLRQSGTDFEIISNGVFLMDTRDGRSERLLVHAALAACACPSPRILIGGLGVGFSLAAAAGQPDAAAIDVVEISPEIIRWHGSHLRHLAARAWADPRVTVINADLVLWLAGQQNRYDAICLDIDNGPGWLVRAANQALYRDDGLRRVHAALRPGGAVAVWSAAGAPDFEARLRRHFGAVQASRVPVARGEPDVVYTATRPPAPQRLAERHRPAPAASPPGQSRIGAVRPGAAGAWAPGGRVADFVISARGWRAGVLPASGAGPPGRDTGRGRFRSPC